MTTNLAPVRPVLVRRARSSAEVDAVLRGRHLAYCEEHDFLTPTPDGRIHDRFDAYFDTTVHLVAERSGRVVGGVRYCVHAPGVGLPVDEFFDFSPHLRPGDLMACGGMMFVTDAEKRRGVATWLVLHGETWAAEWDASVMVGTVNPEIEQLFARLGYRAVGPRQTGPHGLQFVPVLKRLGGSSMRSMSGSIAVPAIADGRGEHHMQLVAGRAGGSSSRPDDAPVVIGGRHLDIADVVRVARHSATVQLSDDPAVTSAVEQSCAYIRRAVAAGERVYGVTTAYGAMANVEVTQHDVAELQRELVWHLRAGAGRRLSDEEVRAAMLIRANSHMRGASGISLQLVRRLEVFLNAGVTPHVLEFGSIGASGDLVPLAAITGALIGLDPAVRVDFRGTEVDALTALARLGLPPFDLGPKEGLAMVNGTAAMAGIAALCVNDAWSQLVLTLGAHALMIQALGASLQPFDPFIHRHKPHPGQVWSAQTMRVLLAGSAMTRDGGGRPDGAARGPVQDRYSVRCLPQFVGPIVDGLATIARQIETEINSTTDNPLIDVPAGEIRHAGNFLGEYVGIAMDQLRHYIGLLAKHLDVQIALLVTPEFSGGLPPSLVGNAARHVNMGLKGLQITANSIMPMLGFMGNPLVDRFATHAEQFNQNINSLGFGAARLARDCVATFHQYLAIAMLLGIQAVDARTAIIAGHYDARHCLSPATTPLYEATRAVVGRPPSRERGLFWDNHDQALDEVVATLAHDLAHGHRVLDALEAVRPADLTVLADRAPSRPGDEPASVRHQDGQAAA